MVESHLIPFFWARVDRRADDECWPWTGSISSTGYGIIARPKGLRPRTLGAHRLSALLHIGEPPEWSQVVMHSCDNPRCVNPKHLRYGTYTDNNRDASQKGRLGRDVTHCKYGHAYTLENTYTRKSGYRDCVVCRREWRKRWAKSNKRKRWSPKPSGC